MFKFADVQRLMSIQQNVFSRFVYTKDIDNYGVEERWADIPNELLTQGVIKGDCDDYARICMLNVMNYGYNARLIFCRVYGEGHLICEVSDSEYAQAFYFDNCHDVLVNFEAIATYELVYASPWNPGRNDKRSWLTINQSAVQRRLVEIFGSLPQLLPEPVSGT